MNIKTIRIVVAALVAAFALASCANTTGGTPAQNRAAVRANSQMVSSIGVAAAGIGVAFLGAAAKQRANNQAALIHRRTRVYYRGHYHYRTVRYNRYYYTRCY